jgi:hypothetical protein
MDQDKLMNDVAEIMDNGQDLPARVTNRLLAAMILHNHGIASEANERSEDNEKRIIKLEVIGGILGSTAFIIAVLKATGVF